MAGKQNAAYGTGSNAKTLKNKNQLSLDLPVLIDNNDYKTRMKQDNTYIQDMHGPKTVSRSTNNSVIGNVLSNNFRTP